MSFIKNSILELLETPALKALGLTVSALKWCINNVDSTSSLPPFIVDLLTIKDYSRFNLLFQWEF